MHAVLCQNNFLLSITILYNHRIIKKHTNIRLQDNARQYGTFFPPHATGAKATIAGGKSEMSRAYMAWDQAEMGYLTDADHIAKNTDVEGKGHLSREQAVSFASQFHDLKEDNKHTKKQLYRLAFLCVLLALLQALHCC
jgi:hypothetical protein